MCLRPQPQFCASVLRARGAVPRGCLLPLLWLDKWWCWRSKQVPDLFCWTPTASTQTGQKHRAAGSSRHVAACKLKGTVQSNAPPAGRIDICGSLSFRLPSSRGGRGQDQWLCKLAVIQHLAQGRLSRVVAGAWKGSDRGSPKQP